ncbi:MAG: FAD-dependent oxidoreductase [Actinomycetota bacterium]
MNITAFLGYPDGFLSVVAAAVVVFTSGAVIGNAVRSKYRRIYGLRSPARSVRHALVSTLWINVYLGLAFVAMTTPLWWLGRLIDGLVGVSPTVVFVGGLVLLYGAVLVRGFGGGLVNRRFADAGERDEQLPGVAKRVAVIGAGMSGMVAAKELREEGHEVVVFERTDGPGGVWAASKERGGKAWASTLTSSGALNSTFSDDPYPVYHEENGVTPRHFTRQQFHDMITSYDSRHSVFADTLRVCSDIEGIDRRQDGCWVLSVLDTVRGERYQEAFDAVTICTGLNQNAHIPDIEGQDDFGGHRLHAEDYRPDEAHEFQGKRVLVVGIGETSSDVVRDLVANHAAQIYVAQRGATWVAPRNVVSLPPDHLESRFIHAGAMFHRWVYLVCAVLIPVLFPAIRSRRRPPRFGVIFEILVLRHPRKWTIWKLGTLNFTKSDDVAYALEAPNVTLVGEPVAMDETGFTTTDGDRHEADVVVYCSGYRPDRSLVPGSTAQAARDLYKLTIVPDQPEVAVIGMARGQIGSLVMSSEMQARWWALIVSGKRTLPSVEEMQADVSRMGHQTRRLYQPSRTAMVFANSLARHQIGCEPDMFRLFRTDRALWFAVLMGPVSGAQYRLHGQGAKPELAREQLMMPEATQNRDYVDSIDLLAYGIPGAFLVLPLYWVWSRILPGFNAQLAHSSYA